MKREIPILFSTPMVEAIIAGKKTQTRRVIKESFNGCITNGGPHPCPNDPVVVHPGEIFKSEGEEDVVVEGDKVLAIFHCSTLDSIAKCRFGKIGDWLWVKETFWYIDFCGEDNGYVYKASPNGKDWQESDEGWRWKPSIFMPKMAARIWLEVTDIKVKRVQDITWQEIYAEGIRAEESGLPFDPTNIELWQQLWTKINGEESWNADDWTWQISFKLLSANGKPPLQHNKP